MQDHAIATPDTPLSALNDSESLIVRTYRKILLGNKDCPTIARDFTQLYGTDAQEVYATFCTVLCALAYASRRALSVGYPGCLWLTGDERQLLTLIAAVQANDSVRFEAHLRWMTRTELRTALTITLNAFADALRSHGQILPLESQTTPVNDTAPLLRLVGNERVG